MYIHLYIHTCVIINLHLFVLQLVATVSFGTEKYVVNEGDGHVQLALTLSQPLPLEFDTSLILNTINDTNTTSISTGTYVGCITCIHRYQDSQ